MQDKLELFSQKLLEWNTIHNLTGAKTPQEVQKNIDDSLYPLQFLDSTPQKALDIGTGAGFPGLVLAIAMPQTHWILVEPRKKRASFLHYIKTALKLDNVTVIPSRIEEIAPTKVDLITSRAVMPTKDLLQLAKDFINKETTILFYKGEEVFKELDDLKNYQIKQNGKRRYLFLKGKDVI
ncbi:16S rRNA (guanine527-N7)-methyltransferase [Nitratiruptor sp. YY08-26]|uniref:16S rRNA (guanine(527)-N(7))-methyltransferase RsmG n=1 Tax=unclassified Nitratiruptor TaxID=2624044 RepID=UPI001915AF85|nr:MULTISPECIES: 16S rRNA (guanine(527)-N(7))-methyltransferase RsmG [unclassified Nitratiruptor]BCD61532.1 16S rRNA (guanine527-N7)-methyltransferase [Nitratiruptor sp. YY08-13]BCD65466.1 16S rRNA (guanine527-N7)-methyltransferase [Nitratiruptor sp. YY08-26]